MARRRGECRSHCPISFALDIFGDKWTLLVIRDIVFLGKRTYGEFLRSEEGIATNILADRLAWLEKGKIVRKTPDPKDRRTSVYRLTRKGRDLLPIILEIIAWSWKYDPKTATPPLFARKLLTDRAGLIKETIAGLEE